MKIRTFEEYKNSNSKGQAVIQSILNDLPEDKREAAGRSLQVVCGYYYNEGLIEALTACCKKASGFTGEHKKKFGNYLKLDDSVKVKFDDSPGGGISQ